MRFGDADDEDAEQRLLKQRDLGSGLEAQAAVLGRPVVHFGVLVGVGDEEQLVQVRQVRTVRVGPVPLHG